CHRGRRRDHCHPDRARERRHPRLSVRAPSRGRRAEVRRMNIPLIYNVRSMLHRPSTTVATAIGIALVVVTFVGMLALANGFRSAMTSTGRPDNVLVLRQGADAEISSGISREHAAILRSFPDFG